MISRCSLFCVVVAAIGSMGASHRTENFIVNVNGNTQVAQQIGQWAEHYRREKAVQWLGKEMPAWGQPCPLKVTIQSGGAGGATTFAFDRGAILSQEMHVEGPLDRIVASVLPHEITHTVFAYYFRQPLPRWADEGGSVLSEDNIERQRHDELVRLIMAGKQPRCPGAFKLRYLLGLKDYPSGQEVMTLYAQGYSICHFLVDLGGRQQFLAFIAHGMRNGWDSAVQTHYRMNGVEELQTAWLDWMRGKYQPDQEQYVKNAKPTPGQPASVVRGQTEDEEYSRPIYPRPVEPNAARDGWGPVYPRNAGRPRAEGSFYPSGLR